MKVLIISLFFLLSASLANAQEENSLPYTVNEAKQVVVQTMVENLPLSKEEIFSVAQNYLTEAYDPTRFTLSTSDASQGTVIGEGTLVNFFDYQLGLNQYYLDVTFKLRIDSKDSRARVSIIVDTYSGKCIDGNRTNQVADRIADFQPVCQENDKKKLMYRKAFPVMMKTFENIINEVSEKLRKSKGGSVGSDDW